MQQRTVTMYLAC